MAELSKSFPEGAPVCAAGDYLLCARPEGGWQLYRVEDLLLVRRLIPAADDPSLLLIEEELRDSMATAHADEVQLLLTAFAPAFAGEADALEAIRAEALAESARGLLRSAGELAGRDCRVLREGDA